MKSRKRHAKRRFIKSVIVVFVASMLLDFGVHGMLLEADYAELAPQMFRVAADADEYFPYMLLAHVALAVGLTWIYRGLRTARPWPGQGLRFGFALALATTIPTALVYFAVQPMPGALVAKQVAYGSVAMLLLGLAIAAANRDPVAQPDDAPHEDAMAHA